MMDYSTLPEELVVRCEGAVRIVTLNRPDDRNAINGRLHDALAEVWSLLERDGTARAVVIMGSGEMFSAGGDYAWFSELQQDRREMELAVRTGRQIIERMVRCELPVVAAIKGAAVGLGASIGVLSDLVVMSEDGFYRDPHVVLGLVAGDGGVAWPFSTGMHVAKEFLLLGERLPASEAHRVGLVNRVVAREAVDDEALALATRLAELEPRAVQATKRALNMQLERGIHGGAEYALANELVSMLGGALAAPGT